MNLLPALLSAVAWGSLGTVTTLIGGSPKTRTLGMTLGTLMFALVVFFIRRPELNSTVIIFGALSGLAWSFGQIFQFRAMNLVGVTLCVPVSNGMQLIGNTLIGAIVYHEWVTRRDFSIGIPALLILLAGLFFTMKTDPLKESTGIRHVELISGIKNLLISTSGYLLFFVFSNGASKDAYAVLLPQAVGMVAGALAVSLKAEYFNKQTFGNLFSGLLWGTGNILLLTSIKANGLAVSFSLAQLAIIFSTLSGILILKERKTPFELRWITAGCFFVITGGILLGYLKSGQ